MPLSIDDRVLDFYGELFEHIFSKPFHTRISERRRLNEVIRQVEAAADAASSSLSRFFLNQKLSEETVAGILTGFARMRNLLQLEDISNPNVTTEEIVESLLNHLPCPQVVQQTHDAVYRLALYTVVQVLMLVGPVMAEWQKLNFSSTFELVRRVVNRLNEISDQINAQGQSDQAGVDQRYELLHRDYLLQRFHRIEAGTVRMTTNLDVDLRELFVMPRVVVRKLSKTTESVEENTSSLMNLAAARRLYGDLDNLYKIMLAEVNEDSEKVNELTSTALGQVKLSSRTVIVGLPGAGKSTFFEWLQVKVASVEEKFILEGQQAIPLLLRVPEIALFALIKRSELNESRSEAIKASLHRVISVLLRVEGLSWTILLRLRTYQDKIPEILILIRNIDEKQEFTSLIRQLAARLKTIKVQDPLKVLEVKLEIRKSAIAALNHWANFLEDVKPIEKQSRKPILIKSRSNRINPKRGKLR